MQMLLPLNRVLDHLSSKGKIEPVPGSGGLPETPSGSPPFIPPSGQIEGSIRFEGVKFSYPTTAYEGLPTMLEDLNTFCGMATDVSIYMPEDAFYIDLEEGRVAVELQFRAFQRGAKQVVNDVWVATVEDGKITIIKEYLDGRVKDLQALGVLQLEESPAFLTPWPPRTEEWAECFPIAKAAPVNTCPPTE